MDDQKTDITAVEKSQRVISIDALRGFDMFWICGGAAIFASLQKISDNPATAFISNQLKHASWEGFTFEDIIMPLFMFIVGAAMVFSFDKRQSQGLARLYLHVLKRFAILFILGMIYQGRLLDFDWSTLYFYNNTLQAIAVGYLGASLIMLLKVRSQIVVTIGLLMLYWALMKFAAVPAHGAGVLTAEGNFAAYIDNLVLGSHRHGKEYTWILSSLVFIVTVMIGAFAGQLLRSDKSGSMKTLCLLGFGIGCLAAGYLWSFECPIIKKIWTSSFTLVSGGYCLLLLAMFYWVIDVVGFKKWAFAFVVIGSNAIAVYMVAAGSRFVDFQAIAAKLIYGLNKWVGPWASFMEAATGFLIMWLILWWMYRKKTFIKI
jgi:predicted acyltransferase